MFLPERQLIRITEKLDRMALLPQMPDQPKVAI
jgi:hypothetical protein